jgi:hypothetical protein
VIIPQVLKLDAMPDDFEKLFPTNIISILTGLCFQYLLGAFNLDAKTVFLAGERTGEDRSGRSGVAPGRQDTAAWEVSGWPQPIWIFNPFRKTAASQARGGA